MKGVFHVSKNNGLRGLIILNTISYIIMIAVNILANVLPINGVTTAEVANSYQNLFTPAPITFAIWGVIYLLLAAFVVYQFGALKGKRHRGELINNIGIFFAVSSFANAAWIFAWHYKNIAASLVIMIIILLSLMIAYTRINSFELTKRDKAFVRFPFSVYFGWITIATIANITVWLVSIGWSGWGLSDQTWTIIVIALGMIIALTTMITSNDIAYGLVIIWAYIGILIKQLSPSGFNSEYTGIIIAAAVSILILTVAIIYILYKRKAHSRYYP